MQQLLDLEFSQLLRDIEYLVEQIQLADTPKELTKFQMILIDQCEQIQDDLRNNLIMVELADEIHILKDLISELGKTKTIVQQLSSILAPPAINASSNEHLGLIFTNWLHGKHSDTHFSGVAVATGRWEVLASSIFAIYYIPLLEQVRLLYLPLLFHEFGHILYLIHRPEMDALVREFQDMVLDYLEPARRRNDAYAEKHSAPRQSAIHYTWYSWLTELYCDAVGFEIGGASYLNAFSGYLRHFRVDNFIKHETSLVNSSHPITWLRVKLLVQRACGNGFENEGQHVKQIWQSIADRMGVVEDYYGYYDEMLSAELVSIIDDMLTQTSPKRYDTENTDYLRFDINTVNPVQLANAAWLRFEVAPEEYPDWERNVIKQYLQRFTH